MALLVLILMGDSIKSFKPDDLCLRDKMKSCVAYACGAKYCTYDEVTCDSFISWGKLMKKHTKKAKTYNSFKIKIKKCKNYDYLNQWSHRFHFG